MDEAKEKAREMSVKARETAGKMTEAVKQRMENVDVSEMKEKAKETAAKMTEKAKETIGHFTHPSDKQE